MITKKNLYTIVFVALAIISLIAIYYLSRKSECCGSCHIASHTTASHVGHDHGVENNTEHMSIDDNE